MISISDEILTRHKFAEKSCHLEKTFSIHLPYAVHSTDLLWKTYQTNFFPLDDCNEMKQKHFLYFILMQKLKYIHK